MAASRFPAPRRAIPSLAYARQMRRAIATRCRRGKVEVLERGQDRLAALQRAERAALVLRAANDRRREPLDLAPEGGRQDFLQQLGAGLGQLTRVTRQPDDPGGLAPLLVSDQSGHGPGVAFRHGRARRVKERLGVVVPRSGDESPAEPECGQPRPDDPLRRSLRKPLRPLEQPPRNRYRHRGQPGRAPVHDDLGQPPEGRREGSLRSSLIA